MALPRTLPDGNTAGGSSGGYSGATLLPGEFSGMQLAMLGVVAAGVVVLNDRAPKFVQYTLLLVLAYLVITNADGVAQAGESLLAAMGAATRGGG
jgi:hypothetical protein